MTNNLSRMFETAFLGVSLTFATIILMKHGTFILFVCAFTYMICLAGGIALRATCHEFLHPKPKNPLVYIGRIFSSIPYLGGTILIFATASYIGGNDFLNPNKNSIEFIGDYYSVFELMAYPAVPTGFFIATRTNLLDWRNKNNGSEVRPKPHP